MPICQSSWVVDPMSDDSVVVEKCDSMLLHGAKELGGGSSCLQKRALAGSQTPSL